MPPTKQTFSKSTQQVLFPHLSPALTLVGPPQMEALQEVVVDLPLAAHLPSHQAHNQMRVATLKYQSSLDLLLEPSFWWVLSLAF